jgi:hypothetical protein
MTNQQLFSPNEWRNLQFGVLDVFMMVSQIDGKTGMDAAEKDEFFFILKHPGFSDNELLRELLASLANDPQGILKVYSPQYRFDPNYFENSFNRIGSIVDDKMDKETATSFKEALAVQLGGAIANASGEGMAGLGKVEERELLAITTIAKWLKTDISK